ncbi:hypothetical protein QBC43DRAFT_358578 [Cladorrhinum sp. PSN259]|nr:hypothetical protein QBC43DRAFT_358578 [Cladorrhinum sp. PSN259]
MPSAKDELEKSLNILTLYQRHLNELINLRDQHRELLSSKLPKPEIQQLDIFIENSLMGLRECGIILERCSIENMTDRENRMWRKLRWLAVDRRQFNRCLSQADQKDSAVMFHIAMVEALEKSHRTVDQLQNEQVQQRRRQQQQEQEQRQQQHNDRQSPPSDLSGATAYYSGATDQISQDEHGRETLDLLLSRQTPVHEKENPFNALESPSSPPAGSSTIASPDTTTPFVNLQQMTNGFTYPGTSTMTGQPGVKVNYEENQVYRRKPVTPRRGTNPFRNRAAAVAAATGKSSSTSLLVHSCAPFPFRHENTFSATQQPFLPPPPNYTATEQQQQQQHQPTQQNQEEQERHIGGNETQEVPFVLDDPGLLHSHHYRPQQQDMCGGHDDDFKTQQQQQHPYSAHDPPKDWENGDDERSRHHHRHHPRVNTSSQSLP